MSESQESAAPQSNGEATDGLNGSAQPVKPIHTIIGAVFLLACVAVCGNFMGWFGSKGSGLGVSREQVLRMFDKTGLAFHPAGDLRGYPTEEATSMDGRSVIRLVGPKNDLVYVSVTLQLGTQAPESLLALHVMYQVALVRAAVPDWDADAIANWLSASTNQVVTRPAIAQVEERRGKGLVKVSVSRSPRTMTVSVESEKW